MSVFTDTHVHLGDPAFDEDRESVIDRALACGVARLVEIADHPGEWDRAIAIARARPGHLRCTLGLHPYHAALCDEDFPRKLRTALAAAEVSVAIGEIGLDYARCPAPRDVQRRAFAALLSSAREWDVPVVVHCRDAFADLVPMLRDVFVGPPAARRFHGVVHCFSGTPDEAAACAALGFALGADGPITYKKNDALREAFRAAGPGAGVLETDSPYLPPQSARGRRNEPSAIPEIAAKLAEIWSMSPDEVARRTGDNASALYRWP